MRCSQVLESAYQRLKTKDPLAHLRMYSSKSFVIYTALDNPYAFLVIFAYCSMFSEVGPCWRWRCACANACACGLCYVVCWSCRVVVFVACPCNGCDIVQSDHAPEGWSCTGDLPWRSHQAPGWTSRRAGRRTEEEVERRVRETTQDTKHKCACMDDMEWQQGETWATSAMYEHMCIYRRCAACSELRNVRVSVHCGVMPMFGNVLKHVQVVREDVRSLP